MAKQTTNKQSQDTKKQYPIWNGFESYSDIQKSVEYRKEMMETNHQNKLNFYYAFDDDGTVTRKSIDLDSTNKIPHYRGKLISHQPVIHVKYRDLRKMFVHSDTLENSSKEEVKYFAEEYLKYFWNEESQFKTPIDVINYIRKHNIPIIFYQNAIDKEMDEKMINEYFYESETKDH